jgi:hypothetical protein
MKKLFFTFSIFALSQNLFAQGFYIKAGGAYAMPLGSQNLNLEATFYNLEIKDFTNYTKNTDGSETYKEVNVSLGKGINFGVGGGYLFTKNIGAEINFSYLLGGKSKASTVGGSYPESYQLTSKMLQIMPALVITGGYAKLDPFLRAGVVLGTGSVTYQKHSVVTGDDNLMEIKMNKGIAIGGNAAAGIEYNLSSKISLSGEINFTSLSFSPKKGEITKLEDNGVSYLNGVPSEERKFDLVDSYSVSPSNNAEQTLKYKFPFGSFGVGIFVVIKL